ncbi:lipid-A-disaccharide synthase [bacterium]|nr:MAG: lipid-A-disaccharide synthase [bacterium]
MEKKIILVCGEPSGDLQAGLLATRLKELDPELRILAVGGEHLRRAGAEIFHDIKNLSVLGFFDAVRKLGDFKALMRLVLDKIEEARPQAVIFVDFSGFNLRLAKKINKRVKTIYYISPQAWASRPGRVETIRRYIDKLIVIFKFERDFYARFGVEAEFIGHPLLDIIKPSLPKEEALRMFGLNEGYPIFALLPGSRVSEIKAILPVMLQSALLIKEKIPRAQFIISKPASLDNALYKKILASSSREEIKLIEARQYDCLNVADFVLVASGTATLETAIMQKPNVVIYKMGWLNYLLYRPLVRIPFIGMENIVAGRIIAPEFIQSMAKPRLIADTILGIFQDKEKLLKMREDFLEVKEQLGEPQAPLRAAQSILTFLVLGVSS